MSARVVYVGDEVSAAGYRLAGVDTFVPNDGDESRQFARALTDAALVLLSAAVAARIPEPELRRAQAALQPLLLVVPEAGGEVTMPPIVQRLRVQLGLET